MKDELRILGDLWNPDGIYPPVLTAVSLVQGLTCLTGLQVHQEQGTYLVSMALGMALETACFSDCEKCLYK